MLDCRRFDHVIHPEELDSHHITSYNTTQHNMVKQDISNLNITDKSINRIVWYKPTDLRIHDNPVLTHAHTHHTNCTTNKIQGNTIEPYDKLRQFLNNSKYITPHSCNCIINVLHIFIFDPLFTTIPLQHTQLPKMGILRLHMLLQSIENLQHNLKHLGSKLYLAYGSVADIIPTLCQQYNIDAVYTSSAFVTHEIQQLNKLRKLLQNLNVQLHDAWMNSMIDINDCPFEYGAGPNIYTTFRTQIEKNMQVTDWANNTLQLHNVSLLPNVIVHDNDDILSTELPPITKFNHTQIDIDQQLQQYNSHHTLIQLHGGERNAVNHLHNYIYTLQLPATYKDTRNGLLTTTLFSTQFSSYLSHGTLSPRLIYSAVKQFESTVVANNSTYWILFELLWRDYWRLVIAPKFNQHLFTKYGIQSVLRVKQPSDWVEPGWNTDQAKFHAWCTGTTGYTLIDACMRELNATGYMSNRGRQIVASFFTKDLCMDWRYGAEYFESRLLDYDPASNWGNWQYAAGVGTDPRAGRYFSVSKQAQQYDSDNKYISYWCEEYKNGTYNVTKICALRFDGSKGHHNNHHKFHKNTNKQYNKHIQKQQSRGFVSTATSHQSS